jgi:sugar (pentulose or hexulose) kinase
MTALTTVAAVDLGASSGRVMLGSVGPDRLELHEAHRFPNVPVRVGSTLYWDILRLYSDVLDGLRAAAARAGDPAGAARGPAGSAAEVARPAAGGAGRLASAGIDSWGVDFGLLDETGALLGNPVHYRDGRTADAVPKVLARVPGIELYETTGIQQMPINTIYQLAAAEGTSQLAAARTLLLIPDLLAYWLTGEPGAEVTNASTTQLYDVRARSWAWPLIGRAGIPARLFPPLRQPGTVIGPLLPGVAADHGLPDGLPVVAVGSHDTASAVAAVPASGTAFAYISCGTWALAGMELDKPVLTEASFRANFTNETGIDGRIRYLRNVTGLWLLQESLRAWAAAGQPADLAALLAEAARLPALTSLVNPDDPVFLPPGDMPARIADACRRAGEPVPGTPAATVRCILDSLALAFRRVIAGAQELSGRHADVVHLVGGGARNDLLCQLTADACGLPVIAGPVEAAALGNVLVQARALGAAPRDLDGMRALLCATQRLRRFGPRGHGSAWQAAERRLPAGAAQST